MRYFVIILLMCSVVLGGCNTKSDSSQIQELRDSIAVLNDALSAVKAQKSSVVRKTGKDYSKWVGEYCIMDDLDRIWGIRLCEDRTAVATCEETGKTFYASWRIESSTGYEPDILFSRPYPDIAFLHERGNCTNLYFREGYVYPTFNAAMAKNPDNRLGILEDI